MENEERKKDNPEKSETVEQREKKLALIFEGNFYLKEGDCKKALESYKKAQAKEKLEELAETCGRRGESRVAYEAIRAVGEFVPKETLKKWGDRALEFGMLEEAIFVYKEAKCLSELPDGRTILFGLDRDLFERCGDIVFSHAKRAFAEHRQDAVEKEIEHAARAYEIAKKSRKLIEIGDWFLRETPVRGDPNTRKAQEFYKRAARAEVYLQDAEKATEPLFTSEELSRAAEKAAEFEKDVPFAPAGKSKRRDEEKKTQTEDKK